MRRKASGLRVLHLFWAACLCAPPAARLWLDFSDGPRAESAPQDASARIAALESRLREAELDLRALGVTSPDDEYEPILGRVLSRDPASSRDALLVGVRSKASVPRDIAATTDDRLLIGRVLDVVESPFDSGFAVAQVQTLLDKGFRVRVLVGESPGLAAGTGFETEDGHALLELLFLESPRELREGDIIGTEGAGGVFAPGIPVGSITLESGGFGGRRRSRYPLIRSDVVIERKGRIVPRRVVLLRDAMRLSAAGR